jgi:hypothetical protein
VSRSSEIVIGISAEVVIFRCEIAQRTAAD